jgi:hypothetical protein
MERSRKLQREHQEDARMIDRPDAATLLRAMSATLSDEVVPSARGPAQHAARVVANLCRILERELLAGGSDGNGSTRAALADLLGRSGSLEELVQALDQRLQTSDERFDAAARAVLLADVRRRLAIDRPGYDA